MVSGVKLLNYLAKVQMLIISCDFEEVLRTLESDDNFHSFGYGKDN